MIRTIILALFLCFLEGHASFISGSIGMSHLTSSVYSPSKPYPSLYLELGFFDEPTNILDFKYSLGLRRYGFFYQKKILCHFIYCCKTNYFISDHYGFNGGILYKSLSKFFG